MTLFDYVKANYMSLLIIFILICLILVLINARTTDSFSNVPPNIEELQNYILVQQKRRAETEAEDKAGDVPNYGMKEEKIENVPEFKLEPNNIIRQKTGVDYHDQERYVSVYDANFSGILGTTLGTS
jgi:hypothetical protein